MRKKYLHPEKLFGIGLTPIEKVINDLSTIGKLKESEKYKILVLSW